MMAKRGMGCRRRGGIQMAETVESYDRPDSIVMRHIDDDDDDMKAMLVELNGRRCRYLRKNMNRIKKKLTPENKPDTGNQ